MRIDNLYTYDLYDLCIMPIVATKVWPNDGEEVPARSWSHAWPQAMGAPVYDVQREARWIRNGIKGEGEDV